MKAGIFLASGAVIALSFGCVGLATVGLATGQALPAQPRLSGPKPWPDKR